MRKLAVLAALALVVTAVSADASNVTYGIREAVSGLTTVNVSPPAVVNFEITAVIDDGTATSDGLALWGSDLTFGGTNGTIANLAGGVLADPTAAPMTSFDYPNGVTNPPHVTNASGYRGTNNGTVLLQAGGGQNTIGNPGPTPPFPVGTVTEEVGVALVVVATGSYNVPAGTTNHTISVANCFANTIDNNEAGPTVYNVSAATTTCTGVLTINAGTGPNLTGAVSDGTACDIALALSPGRTTDSRQQGASSVIVFNYSGAQSSNAVTIQEDASCPTPPTYGPYTGPAPSCVAALSAITCTFTPALPNARAYRFTVPHGAGTTNLDVRMLIGDANGDGLVNATDRSVVVAQWTAAGYACGTDQFTDINDNGATDATDRSLVVAAWTGGPTTNCAP